MGLCCKHIRAHLGDQDSDKLVALSGLAKRMKKIVKSQYLAGLWLRDLLRQLLWIPYDRDHGMDKLHKIRPTQYRAPSWSWASAATFITTAENRLTNLDTIYVAIEEAQVQPAAGQDDTGQLVGGHIRLTGAPIAAELVRPIGIGRLGNLELNVNGKICEAIIRSDAPVVACPVTATLLPTIRGDVDGEDRIRALLHDAVEGKPQGWYRRFGTLSTRVKSHDAVDDILARISDPSLCDASLCLEGSPGTIMLI
ncbi:hypothetical protein PG996_009433 [Apiospora saccharicola]|uniref:Uncharacterized protein n=1 Tax=Apiospora saccharicola TaxID=335842 RepID=A0ABR1UKR6_9PEZI